MAIKLKFPFKIRKQSLLLAGKAAIFAAGLFWAGQARFGLFPVAIFIALAAIFYLRPIFQTFPFLISFLLLIILALALTATFPAGRYPLYLALIFSWLFYLLLGIKNVALVHRSQWYYLLHLSLFYGLMVLFFVANHGSGFFLKTFLLFLVSGWLIKEFLASLGKIHEPASRALTWTLAFFIAEAGWALSLLPIGFLHAAGVIIALIFIVEQTAREYLSRELTGRTTRINFAVFISLLVVLFATAKWRL